MNATKDDKKNIVWVACEETIMDAEELTGLAVVFIIAKAWYIHAQRLLGKGRDKMAEQTTRRRNDLEKMLKR